MRPLKSLSYSWINNSFILIALKNHEDLQMFLLKVVCSQTVQLLWIGSSGTGSTAVFTQPTCFLHSSVWRAEQDGLKPSDATPLKLSEDVVAINMTITNWWLWFHLRHSLNLLSSWIILCIEPSEMSLSLSKLLLIKVQKINDYFIFAKSVET